MQIQIIIRGAFGESNSRTVSFQLGRFSITWGMGSGRELLEKFFYVLFFFVCVFVFSMSLEMAYSVLSFNNIFLGGFKPYFFHNENFTKQSSIESSWLVTLFGGWESTNQNLWRVLDFLFFKMRQEDIVH